MPSSLNLNGLRIYRPGIYGIIDASALGGKGISTGNVAIVGEFPSIEQNAPLTFTSARAVKDFDPDNLTLQAISKTAFSPSTDDRVPGGSATLTMVNIQGNTQSVYPGAKDSNGDDSLLMKSGLWGKKGNQVFASLNVNADDPLGLDIVLGKGSVSESYVGVQSGEVAKFYYSGTQLSRSVLSIDPSALTWTWGKDAVWTGGGGNVDQVTDPCTEAVVDNGSEIKFSMTDGATVFVAGKTASVSVVGKDKNGGAVTGTASISFVEFNGLPTIEKTLQSGGQDIEWGQVEDVTFSIDQVDFNGTTKLDGTAYSLDLVSDFDYCGQVAGLIDNNSNLGFHAEAIHPRINKIPSEQMDKQASIDVHNGAGADANNLTVRADLWAIIEALGASILITAERASGATLRPGPASLTGWGGEQLFFVGGSESVASVADYDAALAAIEFADIQIVVGMSDQLQVAKKLSQHCITSAVAGYERNAYFGTPKNKTLKEVFDDYTSKINSRHVACAAQEVYLEDATGTLTWYDPTFFAIMLAGMQAGTSVATPLTWKRPSVYDVRCKWDPSRDANEAISKGIINLSKDNLGIKVERSVTTWLEDDNPIYSEVSSNESINTSIRDLRGKLLIRIGDAVYGNTASKLKGLVESQLNKQVKDGVIKAWRNVLLEDLGDTVKVTYEVAAVEPLNFIVLTASVVRIASET
jgi:hypothetical protein